MITDLSKEGTSPESTSTVPRNKSGAMPKSFFNEYKDKKELGIKTKQMSDVITSVKELTNEMRQNRQAMKHSSGGISGKTQRAQQIQLDSRSTTVMKGGAKEMADSAKQISMSTKLIAKQTSLFSKSIDRFGAMSRNTVDKLSRTANRLASTAAAAPKKGLRAAGRGIEKTASFATDTDVARQFEQDLREFKESGREQMMNMLFLGNPLLSYMGQGAIKGMSPLVKKTWQKMKSRNKGGFDENALMRHQGGLIFAHEGNLIQDPRGKKRPLKKDEHVTVLKEGEMVLPTHEKTFMEKFSKSVADGVVTAQEKVERIKSKSRERITSSTPAVRLPQVKYFEEMQRVMEESQKLMTMNTYGRKASPSGIRTAFAHAVIPFASKYRSELSNTENMGVLGGMLNTLSSMYVTGRAQSSDMLQQQFQTSKILKVGLGVEGNLKKPKSASFTEAIVKRIKYELIGRQRERAKIFQDKLLGTHKVIKKGQQDNPMNETNKLISQLVKVVYNSNTPGTKVPAPRESMTTDQIVKNSVRTAKFNRVEILKKVPGSAVGRFGHSTKESLIGRLMGVGDKIGETNTMQTAKGFLDIGKRLAGIAKEDAGEKWNKATLPIRQTKNKVKKKVKSIFLGMTQGSIPFWTRRYKSQLQDWGKEDATRTPANIDKIYSLAESLVGGDTDKIRVTSDSFFKVYEAARYEILDKLASEKNAKQAALKARLLSSRGTGEAYSERASRKSVARKFRNQAQAHVISNQTSWNAKRGDFKKKARALRAMFPGLSEEELFNFIENNPTLLRNHGGRLANRPDKSNDFSEFITGKMETSKNKNTTDTEKRKEVIKQNQLEASASQAQSVGSKLITVKGGKPLKTDPSVAGKSERVILTTVATISKKTLEEDIDQGKELKKQTQLLTYQNKDIAEDESEEAQAKKKGIWGRMFGGKKKGEEDKKGGIMSMLGSPWGKMLSLLGAGFAVPALGALFGGKDLGKMGKSALVGAGIGAILGIPLGLPGMLVGASAGAAIGGMMANGLKPIKWVMAQVGVIWRERDQAWKGALIGGSLGFFMGGPLGALAGVALGSWAIARLQEFKDNANNKDTLGKKAQDILPDMNYSTAGMHGALVGGVMGLMLGGPHGAMAGSALGAWAFMRSAEFMDENPDAIVTRMWKKLGLKEHSLGASAGATIGSIIGFMFGGPVGMVAGAAAGTLVGANIARIMSIAKEGKAEQEKLKNQYTPRRQNEQGNVSIGSDIALDAGKKFGINIGNKHIAEMEKEYQKAKNTGYGEKDVSKGLKMRDAAMSAFRGNKDNQAFLKAKLQLDTEIASLDKGSFSGTQGKIRQAELEKLKNDPIAYNLALQGKYKEFAGQEVAKQLGDKNISKSEILKIAQQKLKDANDVVAFYEQPDKYETINDPTGLGNDTQILKKEWRIPHQEAIIARDSYAQSVQQLQASIQASMRNPSEGGILKSAWGVSHESMPGDKSISKYMNSKKGGPLANAMTTSGFGNRLDPITGRPAFHDGVDMISKSSTVTATTGGIVINSGRMGDRGNVVEVMQTNGKIASYDHLASISVKNGQWVDIGSVIGQVGTTGRSTGRHLHYREEMISSGKRVPVMPMGGQLDELKEFGTGVYNKAASKEGQAAMKKASGQTNLGDIFKNVVGSSSRMYDQYGEPIRKGAVGGITKVLNLIEELFSEIFGGITEFIQEGVKSPEKFGSLANTWQGVASGSGLSSGYWEMFKNSKFKSINDSGYTTAVSNMIKMHEASKTNKPNLEAYRDSRNVWTIGYGHKIKNNEQNLMNGITPDIAEALFQQDLANSAAGVKRLTSGKIEDLDPYRAAALLDMSFNMGAGSMGRGLSGFTKMWRKLGEGDLLGAGAEVLDSRYAQQVGNRSLDTAQLITTGSEQANKNSPNYILNLLRSSAGRLTSGGAIREVATGMYNQVMGAGITKSMIDRWQQVKQGAQGLLSSSTFWPPAQGYLTSPLGERWGGFHKGIDIGGGDGTPVHSVWPGIVSKIAYQAGGAGNYVVVNHGNGLYSKYMHMKDGSISVAEGQQISSGDILGLVGNTGHSTGPHLHFELGSNKDRNSPSTVIDPQYLFSSLPFKPNGVSAGGLSTTLKSLISSPKVDKMQLAKTPPTGPEVIDGNMQGGSIGSETSKSTINNDKLISLQLNKNSMMHAMIGSELGKKNSDLTQALEKIVGGNGIMTGITNNILRGGDTNTSSSGGQTNNSALQTQVEAVMEALLDGRGYVHS